MERPSYSRHARDRMRERNITEHEVEAVLADHDIDLPGNLPGRRAYIGAVAGRRLKVVTVEGTSPTLIVTVMDVTD
jgi:Domain of unknown function (DUF4258)